MKKIVLLFLFPFLGFCQMQIGQTIYGGLGLHSLGFSTAISADGNTIAVGSPATSGNSLSACGGVKIYQNINGSWTQLGNAIYGEFPYDYSGWSISISSNGNVVAIGAPGNDGEDNGSTEFGQVRVYYNNSGNWIQIGQDINGEAPLDNSGRSVSLSSDGTIVAIGAPGNDGNNGSVSNSGHARIYKYIFGTWVQIGDDINGVAVEDKLGTSVSLSNDGSIVAIGGESNSNSYSNVKVLKNIAGVWVSFGNTIFGTSYRFGKSVSLSADGTFIAIGDTGTIGINGALGKVGVYKIINNVWILIGDFILGQSITANFGFSISLSGDGTLVAVGVHGNNTNGLSSGSVRVYKNLNDIWTQIGIDLNGNSEGDQFGWNVSLSEDGTKLIVGAISDGINGQDSGSIKMYDLAPLLSSNTFILENFTITPNPTSQLITINLNDSLEFQKATIYNTLGQIIKTETTKNISVIDLSKGTYFIEVETNKGKATKSFIKE
jgi:hypothetical protein